MSCAAVENVAICGSKQSTGGRSGPYHLHVLIQGLLTLMLIPQNSQTSRGPYE